MFRAWPCQDLAFRAKFIWGEEKTKKSKSPNLFHPQLPIPDSILTVAKLSSLMGIYSQMTWLVKQSLTWMDRWNSPTTHVAVAALGLDPRTVSAFALLSPQAEDGGLIPDVELGHAPHQPPIPKWVAPGRRWRERKGRRKILGGWGEVGREWEETEGHDELRMLGSFACVSISTTHTHTHTIHWSSLLLEVKLEEFGRVRREL